MTAKIADTPVTAPGFTPAELISIYFTFSA